MKETLQKIIEVKKEYESKINNYYLNTKEHLLCKGIIIDCEYIIYNINELIKMNSK